MALIHPAGGRDAVERGSPIGRGGVSRGMSRGGGGNVRVGKGAFRQTSMQGKETGASRREAVQSSNQFEVGEKPFYLLRTSGVGEHSGRRRRTRWLRPVPCNPFTDSSAQRVGRRRSLKARSYFSKRSGRRTRCPKRSRPTSRTHFRGLVVSCLSLEAPHPARSIGEDIYRIGQDDDRHGLASLNPGHGR